MMEGFFLLLWEWLGVLVFFCAVVGAFSENHIHVLVWVGKFLNHLQGQ